MPSDPLSLPQSGPFELVNVHVPACLLANPGEGDLARVDISVADGKISAIKPTIGDPKTGLAGRMVLPGFVDCHTHIDKGHIWQRKSNPNGTFMGALESVGADRVARWSAEDVARRMDFSLRSAYAHGTVAVRTHLDSIAPQEEISWPVFEQMREAWRGRIELQASCLITSERVRETAWFNSLADRVATAGGVLGAVTMMDPGLDGDLDIIFRAAKDRGLDLDFHVDETNDCRSRTLENIADAALRHRFEGRILAGHCCALSCQDDDVAKAMIEKVARAGISVVSLPMCNMYLQDRRLDATTPRWRGVTLLHELAAQGVSVSVASDNTRDPFYAYGDLDMHEVLREATRIAHLDHPNGNWVRSVSATPARSMGLGYSGLIEVGAPADLVIFKGRDWSEVLSRPEVDRVILRQGKVIERALPDYSELDDLMEAV